MPDRTVTFWFDFISPYAYLAWHRIAGICARNEARLALRPVLFAGLLKHWGHKGPAEIPAKRAYTFRDVARLAALQGVPLRPPARHPFVPLTALRVALPQVAGPDQHRIVDTIFAGGWAHGADLGDDEVIARILTEAGLDGPALVAHAGTPEVKAALRRSTEEAIARGLFGVPSMTVGDELFWGHDRLEHLELHLQGRDPLAPA